MFPLHLAWTCIHMRTRLFRIVLARSALSRCWPTCPDRGPLGCERACAPSRFHRPQRACAGPFPHSAPVRHHRLAECNMFAAREVLRGTASTHWAPFQFTWFLILFSPFHVITVNMRKLKLKNAMVTCMYVMEPKCKCIKFDLWAYKSLTKLCLDMFLLSWGAQQQRR